MQSAGGRTSLEAHQCDQCDQPIYSDFPIPKMPAFLPSSCEKARFSLWCPSGVYGRLSVHNHGKAETGPWKKKCPVFKMVIFHVHYCEKERVIKSSTVHPSKHTADMKPLEITIIPPSGFRSLFLHLSAITPCGSVQLRSFTGWFCLAVQKWVCLKFSIYSTEIRFPAFEDIMSQNS